MNSGFQIKDLPLMPQVAAKILQMQEEHLKISFKELEKIILMDPALTAKILKVANSALYARKKEITSLQQAITLLGFKMIKSLVLLVSASSMYGRLSASLENNKKSRCTPGATWVHSLMTAFIGKYLAEELQRNDIKENIFIAGLIHDIGRSIFLINDIKSYEIFLNRVVNQPEDNILEIEREVFGKDHQQVGQIVLSEWNFPDEYIDIIGQHHSLNVNSRYKVEIEIIGLANIYASFIAEGSLSPHMNLLKDNYLGNLSLDDRSDYIENTLLKEMEQDELFSICADFKNI